MGSKKVKLSAKNGASLISGMPSFIPAIPISNSIATENNNTSSSRNSELGAFEQSLDFRIEDAVDIRNPLFSSSKSSSLTIGPDLQFGSSNKTLSLERESQLNLASVSGGPRENWAESDMADASQSNTKAASDSSERSKEKVVDQKAYVQQLENSRLKLTQLEQELQRARQQGIFISNAGEQSHAIGGNGALAFDAEYSRWLEEQNRMINELRTAVNSHATDTELHTVVDSAATHFDDIYRLKGVAAKADVFHILSGMWKTPAERCFMWIGGFRPSELLKLLVNQLEPLTEQQLVGIYNLQQSSQQAEEALSQGMEALQQSLAETLATGTPGPSGSSGNVANYMGQMAMAMGKLGTLEGFLRQADNLRQQTLQQMHNILTTRQSARAVLSIHDYFSRLRALSSLWLARPRD
ncbi:TGACG-sequence-specific DNA-binding protein TGA-2.1 [Bienertia sinuspersici]